MIAKGIRLQDRNSRYQIHPSLTRIITYMAVDTTVNTYRGTRAKKGAIAIKQLPTWGERRAK